MVQRFYDSVSSEVYIGWEEGNSVYMQFCFINRAYAFWNVPFKVTVSSGCWCIVLGSYLCTSYSDLFVPVDWLNLIKFEWIIDLVVQKVQWLFDSVVSEVQRFPWLIVSKIDDWVVISEIDDCVSIIPNIDWVFMIGWCRYIWWLYCSGDWSWASMLFMGPVKKFIKHGPWRKREDCSLL